MKFGHEYETVLASEGFPQEWVDSAIQYKHLKKCIKKIHQELESLGLDVKTLQHLSNIVEQSNSPVDQFNREKGFYSAAQPTLPTISEGFCPQVRILIDNKTGEPLEATLAAETKISLEKLARHEMLIAGRRASLVGSTHVPPNIIRTPTPGDDNAQPDSPVQESPNARWVQVPLTSAKHFFDLLEPKLGELEALRQAETQNLEEEILDVGEAVENVVEPVREGFEAIREVSYRDLYFWREMFRLYMEKPIFYSETHGGEGRGALSFKEAKANLTEFDDQLRSTGLLAKMKTSRAKAATRQFLALNVHILKIMHFQEMNARAMTKILKKFDKQTHLEKKTFVNDLTFKYPALLAGSSSSSKKNTAGSFADSIARDLHAEIGSKVLSIVPQLQGSSWICPVCEEMAWRPVNLGCCRTVFCVRCIIKSQEGETPRCPVCHADTVLKADGRNLDFETMDFLEKYFPLEVKKRQKENEEEQLNKEAEEDAINPRCSIM